MSSLPEILRLGRCPTCKELVLMRFLGVQAGWREIPARTLWLCGGCETSVTGSRFLPGAVEARLCERFGEEGGDGVDLADGGGLVSAGAGGGVDAGRVGDGRVGGGEQGR